MVAVKLLFILVILLLMAYPLLPLSKKMKRFSTFRALRYEAPHNRKNIVFVCLAFLEFLVLAVLFGLATELGIAVSRLSFVDKLLSKVSPQLAFDVRVAVCVIFINLLVLYAFVILKGLLKKILFDNLFHLAPEKKKKGKCDTSKDKAEDKTPDGDKGEDDGEDKAPLFVHSNEIDKRDGCDDSDSLDNLILLAEEDPSVKIPKKRFFTGLFFEGEDYRYARPWVHRVTSILQLFIYFTEILYFAVFFGLLVAVFFNGPDLLYTVLSFITAKIYIYPFVSLIFLQEVCNTLRAPVDDKRRALEEAEEEKREEEKREARLNELRSELLRRFGKEHCIRFFPATATESKEEYRITNKTYSGALSYIRGEMKRSSGRVVQRYMEGLDALFNNKHIYFSASFYSELGEYLIAYTYIRLLAGERQLFLVSDKSRVESLKKYISMRLTALTGCPEQYSWRVQGYGDQRLDEADVLIACPDDFRVDDIVEHYPGFFKECCNAIVVDADRILTLDSYLCPIMALRLHKVTEGRIRFVFLSRDILQGFGSCLKKFFCLDDVVDYSNLEENEKVNYYLWNRESKRIYRGKEQRLTSVEGVIAEEAIGHDVDGVRILTETPLDNAEKSALLDHNVEINEFYKNVPDVNFLICTDERYNLSSAVYAFTRFRGKKASVLHILSKPYLLREYFMSHIEQYVNRSSFIQPRATEHAGTRKLSLLRLFCDATDGEGIDRSEFVTRMQEIVSAAGDRTVVPICPFCTEMEKKYAGGTKLTVEDYAAYLVAGLCDGADTKESESEGHRARDYYIFAIPDKRDKGYRIEHESMIRFTHIRSVFARLLLCNERVELRLNDKRLAVIDTFPSRVYQQYLPGQSIVYDNTEYEIEQISENGRVIYLRQENITFRNCLESVPLRRYLVKREEPVGNDGIVTFSKGPIESITLTREFADLEGETYGFYSLLTDRQTLDFERGMVGNLNVSDEIVEKQKRRFLGGRVLSLSIKARLDADGDGLKRCTDGMRMLMAAVFSEFIRTMFPDAYHCIAVCPVLETPLSYEKGSEIVSFEDHVKTVYPFLKADSEATTSPDEVRLLFINDCCEDVGVLDLLFDYRVMFMQQFLTNIYGYLHWLNKNPTLSSGQKHYIYFGADSLSSVYDLEGCCKLLADCNHTFSDGGRNDVAVVSDGDSDKKREEKKKYCSFCHSELERGRFFAFDSHRFICMNCQTTTVRGQKELDALFEDVKKYLADTYPEVKLHSEVKASLDKVYSLAPEQVFSEYYYRLDTEKRTVMVELDNPELNAAVSLLRGLIGFWQRDNNLDIPHAAAQLYYEELCYLRYRGEENAATWIRDRLDSVILEMVCEIEAYVEKAEPAEEGGEKSKRTSFTFLIEESKKMSALEADDSFEDDSDGTLYDPDDIPRFWKRYLRGAHATDGVDEIPEDSEEEAAEEEEEEDGDNGSRKQGRKEEKEPKPPKRKHACGMKRLAIEEDEATNPKIALYNEIVRHAADFDDSRFSVSGVSAEEVFRIFKLVSCDYPELFWMENCSWYLSGNRVVGVALKFRCLGADGKIDRKQVLDKLKAMRKGAKPFTKGISKHTDPYKALVTIYRRLILMLDYDGVGLDNGADKNRHSDDSLRSLYSALVNHRVVCAGYAVAMQYLLQKVGLPCAYVISEASGNECHAFNAVKLGSECYYLDATWGDASDTKTGSANKDIIRYDYCCVPLHEFKMASSESGTVFHTPRKEYYLGLEDFRSTRYEYFRHRGLYFDRYDEAKIKEALVRTVKEYDKKEMGAFCFAFRCSDVRVATYLTDRLLNKGEIYKMIAEIKPTLKKKEAGLLEGSISYFASSQTPTVHIFFS